MFRGFVQLRFIGALSQDDDGVILSGRIPSGKLPFSSYQGNVLLIWFVIIAVNLDNMALIVYIIFLHFVS